MPYLSIVIPTINRYTDLNNTIRYLSNQSFQDYEIVIVDQTDKEKVENISALDSKIRYYWSEIKSASVARNKGLIEAQGEIVLFLDDDVIIENPNFLFSHICHYVDGNLSGVTGTVLDYDYQVLRNHRHWISYNKNWGWLFFPGNYNKSCKINSGRSCNLSIRRSFAIDVGGMDENYKKGAHREESDFNYRMTKKYGWYVFDPKCMLIHIGNPLGGIRSWNDNSYLKAQHHFDGSWYYIFKNIRVWYYPVYIIATLIFFYFDKNILKNPVMFVKTTYRMLQGIINGFKLFLSKPKYINKTT